MAWYIINNVNQYGENLVDEEYVQKGMDEIEPKEKFYLKCTARGDEGCIFATRIFKGNSKMYEYLIFNKNKMSYEWINNNGYCIFKKINQKGE